MGTDERVNIHKLLQTMVDSGASDLHLTVGVPATLRIHGEIRRVKSEPLSPQDIQAMVYSLLNDRQKKRFEEDHEIDLSFGWKDISRFRANFFWQRGSVAGTLRQIPYEVMTLEDIGVPPAVLELVDKSHGLIFVTGPTGSGKSTTLAAMIDAINTRRRGHIITIEDPIEFLHKHRNCIVNQREVGTDTLSFKDALRYVLRQDPDVVLIGEVRDRESLEAALRISETGHLALATLHTNSAVQTIHRILDFFPADQQAMVRTQLSFVLEGIVSQQLVSRSDGTGRCLAMEVLIPNSAIRNLIREDKTHQIHSQMQMGQSKHGMITLNQSLASLVTSGRVTEEQAILVSYDVDELKPMLQGKKRRVAP